MSNRPGRALDIVVCIVYKLDKATRLLDVHLKDLAAELRKDLDAIKMPHPPEANIRPPSLEGVVFSWTTRKYSPLYNVIRNLEKYQDDDTMMDCKKTKVLCSIDKILVSEGPPTDFDKLPKPAAPKRVLRSRFSRSQSDQSDSSSQKGKSTDQRRESLKTDFDQRAKEYENACAIAVSQETMSLLSKQPSQEPSAKKPLAPISFVPASKTSTDQLLAFFPDAVRTEPPSKDSTPPSDSEQAPSLLREYWDTRRKMTAIIAQAEMVEERLERLGVIQPLKKRPTADLPKLLAKAQLDLLRERTERSRTASVLEDVERECRSPVVVPELLKAVIRSI